MSQPRDGSIPDDGTIGADEYDAAQREQRATGGESDRAERADKGALRGPNTPDSLEQPHDQGDVSGAIGIHMHPASLTMPDDESELVTGDELEHP